MRRLWPLTLFTAVSVALIAVFLSVEPSRPDAVAQTHIPPKGNSPSVQTCRRNVGKEEKVRKGDVGSKATQDQNDQDQSGNNGPGMNEWIEAFTPPPGSDYEPAPGLEMGLGRHVISGNVYSLDGNPVSEGWIRVEYVCGYHIDRSPSHFAFDFYGNLGNFRSDVSYMEDGTKLVTTWHQVYAPLDSSGRFEIQGMHMVKMNVYLQKDRRSASSSQLLAAGIYPGHHTFYIMQPPE